MGPANGQHSDEKTGASVRWGEAERAGTNPCTETPCEGHGGGDYTERPRHLHPGETQLDMQSALGDSTLSREIFRGVCPPQPFCPSVVTSGSV